MPDLKKILYLALLAFILPTPFAHAQECKIEERACMMGALQSAADQVENEGWRDQTYREIAKTRAFDGDIDGAIVVLNQIKTPDTKALTIRGIGMAAADHNYSQEQYDEIFSKLRVESEKIKHPPSYAIALTYIAMAQAFAGDNDGAWKTAADMENDALRHKAYGETAEIQAERDNFEAAMKSVSLIESQAFRNKAYSNISKILADREHLQEAYNAAQPIGNPYKRAQAIQYVLDIQKPRDTTNK